MECERRAFGPALAERLFISPGTVKTRLAHIYAKLGMTFRPEVAAEAVRRRTASGATNADPRSIWVAPPPFLTTKAVVAEKPEKTAPAMPGGPGGMGHDKF